MEPLLRLAGISKEFSGVWVLDSVDFDLEEGEVHALLGENGAGKSTLIKIISGAYEKTKGEMFLFGKRMDIKNTKEALELGINTIYQELSLIPGMDIARNMFLGKELKATAIGGLSRQIYSETAEMLKKVGLGHISPTTKVSDIKIAYRQMIEISKAIHTTQCKIIVMDEPTSSLSDEETEQLFALIKELQKQRIGVIYISHKLDEVVRISDRVTVLRDGRKVGTLAKEEIQEKAMLNMMVGRDIAMTKKESYAVGETILRAEGLCFGTAVKDVSFSARKGEILGFFGLVGAGRTELMHLIFAAEKPDAGKVYVGDSQVRFRRPGDAVKAGIGFVPEDRKEQSILPQMSNLSNITIAALSKFKKLYYIDGTAQRQRAAQASKDLKIKHAGLEQPIQYLSGGNQQKCILARWLISGTRILILDEPTRGVDVGAKQDVYAIIRELAKNGLTILLVSSEMPEILNLSDRVIVMHEGEVTAQLSGDEMDQDRIIRHAFGERPQNTAGGMSE